MAKAALKEREPGLDLDLKDVTPKKGDDRPAEQKPAKPAAAKPKNAVAIREQTVPTQAKSFLEVVARIASDPNADAAKARAFLDIQMEIMREEARMSFTTDFIALQKVLPVIDKDGKIDHGPGKQKNLYATYPNIMKVVKPLLREHNFALSSFIEPGADSSKINVVSQLDHVRGHFRKSIFPLGAETSGSKNNVQGWGSSQSYGMRYNAIGLLSIVSMAPQDVDRDGNDAPTKTLSGATPKQTIVDDVDVRDQPKRLTLKQSEALVALIKSSGVELEVFLHKFNVKAVIDLDPSLLSEAEKACRDYAAAVANKKKR